MHKLLLELSKRVRDPVNLCYGAKEQLVGNIHLHVKRDSKVCTTLAKKYYNRELGARSLKAAAQTVDGMLVDMYLEESDEIEELNGLQDFYVDIQGGEVVVRAQEVSPVS